MELTIKEFEKRLEDISILNGIKYAGAHQIFDSENAFGKEVLKLSGYLVLSDAFKCFFLETIGLLSEIIENKRKKPLPTDFTIFVVRLKHNFNDICGFERLALSGYPIQAFPSLRNTFDNIILTSAIVQKKTTYLNVKGIVAGENYDPYKSKKLRKQTEYLVRELMTGSKSGLNDDVINELTKWNDLFDMEVHGGRITLTGAKSWLKGEKMLAVLPHFNEFEFAIFVNRYCEIAWMLHKLTPLLNPTGENFSDSWQNKWKILDESFEMTVESLTRELGKKIGTVMVTFINSKFPFNEKSFYQE